MKFTPYYKIPTIKIAPNGLSLYNQSSSHRRHHPGSLYNPGYDYPGEAPEQTIYENRKTAYSGEITAASRKRMSLCLDLLLSSSTVKSFPHPLTQELIRFRINFITLTLAAYQGDIPDREIKHECLRPWLREMVERHHLNSYVWKAEVQKNQNIHFHLVTDTYIHHTELRECWNRAQNRLGFVDRFEELHGHRYPNSTDIHAVHKMREARNDLVKYITKHQATANRDIGKLWDASYNLKRAKLPTGELDSASTDIINRYLNLNPGALTYKKFMSWIRMPDNVKRYNVPADLLEEYRKVLLKIRAGQY